MGNSYVKFTENNVADNESWYTFVREEGNKEAIAKLRSIIDEHKEVNFEYRYDEKFYPENEVTSLVENSVTGILPRYAKTNNMSLSLLNKIKTLTAYEIILYRRGTMGD